MTRPAPWGTPGLRRLDPSTVHRRMLVTPAMCGSFSLFMGQVGDWTWDAVGEVCNVNVLAARNAQDEPTYLAFYYLHIKASPHAHVGRLTFGAELDVVSRVFGLGSESVLTLHRIALGSSGLRSLDAAEPFEHPDRACIYVESYNRWVSRRAPGRNAELVRSSPGELRHEHLPAVPERYSPRLVCGAAKRVLSFRPANAAAASEVATLQLDYELDPARDVNGVGLMYFAAYFAIVDRGIAALWRRLGRGDAAFVGRVVLDHKLCYLGNADLGATLRLRVGLWRPAGADGPDTFDVVVVDVGRDEPIAFATVVIAPPRDHE